MALQRTLKQKRDLVIGGILRTLRYEGFTTNQKILDRLIKKIQPKDFSKDKWVGIETKKKGRKNYLVINFFKGDEVIKSQKMEIRK
jgi:hypothetical protein